MFKTFDCRLNMHCPQCDHGVVNHNQYLRLQALCHGCNLTDTEFDWTVETLLRGANQDTNVDEITCVAIDGIYSSMFVRNDSKTSTTASTTLVTKTTVQEKTTPGKNCAYVIRERERNLTHCTLAYRQLLLIGDTKNISLQMVADWPYIDLVF